MVFSWGRPFLTEGGSSQARGRPSKRNDIVKKKRKRTYSERVPLEKGSTAEFLLRKTSPFVKKKTIKRGGTTLTHKQSPDADRDSTGKAA